MIFSAPFCKIIEGGTKVVYFIAEDSEGSIIYAHNPPTHTENTADTDITLAVFFDVFFQFFLRISLICVKYYLFPPRIE